MAMYAPLRSILRFSMETPSTMSCFRMSIAVCASAAVTMPKRAERIYNLFFISYTIKIHKQG